MTDEITSNEIPTLSPGIEKTIIQEGTGSYPIVGSYCQVYYEARILPTKEVFDDIFSSKKKKQEFSFEVGAGISIYFLNSLGHVIQAFDEIILTMKRGEVCVMKTPPEFAYGKFGCPPRIPGNTNLEFEIELISFERPKIKSKKIENITQRLEEANKDKLEANDHFKKGNYAKALKLYNKALSPLTSSTLSTTTPDEDSQIISLKGILYVNMSFCHLKRDEISKAIKNAEKAIELDDQNFKAYFRLGQAYAAANEFELAKINLFKAAKQSPNNSEIRKEYDDVCKKLEADKSSKVNSSPFAGIFSKK